MFCGRFLHTIDDKKRFKVPASMRDELGTRVYLIESPDSTTRCIFLYSEAGWEKVCQALMSDDISHDQTRRRMSRKILSNVVAAEVDKAGRITMNTDVKNYLQVEDEIYLVGNINHIELWSPKQWERETIIMEAQSTDSININF